MATTRVTYVLSFVAGTAGLALAFTADSFGITLLGSALFVGSLVCLAAALAWRHGANEGSGTQAIISQLPGQLSDLQTTIAGEHDSLSRRVDGLAAGLLEYVAQMEVDLKEMAGRPDRTPVVDPPGVGHADTEPS